MKALAFAALVTCATVACAQPAGTLFNTTVRNPSNGDSMPVVLADESGLVTAIDSALGDNSHGLPQVRSDPDDPNVVIVSWGTGACDDDTAMSFQHSGAAYRLDLHVDEGLNLGCTADLLIRGLRITFSKRVPADAIVVAGGISWPPT